MKSLSQLKIRYGPVSQGDFEENPVWFEYYVPEQITYLEGIGFPRKWLEEMFVYSVEGTNDSAWFAMDSLHWVPGTCVAVCSANILFGNTIREKGYVTIVEDSITSCRLFSLDIFLSLASVFDEDNQDALNTIASLFSVPVCNITPIRYEMSGKILEIPPTGVLEIPIADSSGTMRGNASDE